MTAAIDITATQRKTLLALLRRYIPGVEVWAYGSRVKWTARPNSDLDLVAFTTPEQQPLVSELKEALAECDLPFLVDFHVWDDVPERFHEIIRKEYVVLQEAKQSERGGSKEIHSETASPTSEGLGIGVVEIPFSELLSDVIDNRGKTCPTEEAGIPLIATNCIRNEHLYPTFDKVRFVSKETYSNWFRGHPKPGDIIFVNKATPGRVCLAPDPVDFCIAQDMVAVRADSKRVYPKYLFAVLRSTAVQEKIGQMHVGTLIPHFKKGDFDKLLLPIPGRKAQEFIGDNYFLLSAKIDANRRMNATLDAIARALFKSWFVDFDPVRAKLDGRQPAGLDAATATLFPEHFEHGEDCMLPVGWGAVAIEELCAINAWTLGKNDDLSELEYVEISEVSRGNIANIATYTRGKEPSRARRRLRHGDTVLSTVRPDRGSYFLALNPPDNRVASTGFAVLTPTKAPWSFIHAAMTQPEVSDYLGQMADGGAYPAVRPEIIGSMKVVLPNEPKILETFHRICAPLFEQAEANRAQSRTLATLRDALLPRLLSGNIRVTNVEDEVASV